MKVLALCLTSALLGFLGHRFGFDAKQTIIIAIFSISILGTLFFWDFRMSFVFIGSGVLLSVGAIDLESFIRFASWDVILFLISMMIIVGMMKDAGLFEWLLTLVLRVKHLTGAKMFVILMAGSAVFSGLMGEVASIIVMVTVILNICDFLEVDPVPLVISAVLATNIGSAATVLGNPVGVLIAARGKLSFEDFLLHALPLSFVILVFTILLLLYWYRGYIKQLSEKLEPYQNDKGFLYLISVPPDFRARVSMAIFFITILLIGLHKRLELFLGIGENTLLIMLPVISAGIVMIYRQDKARHYIEREVEWPSLLFFAFLFAQAGVIQASGIADVLAHKMFHLAGSSSQIITALVLFTSGVLSSILDNVVTVASFIPIVKSLDLLNPGMKPLWWPLLFGACYGGNITMIGSTANIVALGLLEKQKGIRVSFSSWLKIGMVVGLISMLVSYFVILFVPIYG